MPELTADELRAVLAWDFASQSLAQRTQRPVTWILGPAPFYPAEPWPEGEPWPDGWCEITAEQYRRYVRALGQGLRIELALAAAELPPLREGCPEPPPSLPELVTSPQAVTSPPPPSGTQPPAVGVARPAPGKTPRQNRPPRPPRAPRTPRSPRAPRVNRSPRPRRPDRAPRPPRTPRAPRPPRPERTKKAQTSTWCKYEITAWGYVYAAPTIILPAGATIKPDKITPEVQHAFDLAGGQPAGTIWSNTYGLVAPVNAAGRCVVQICSGPLHKLMQEAWKWLPERWRITDATIARTAEATAQAAPTQARPYRTLPAIPSGTTAPAPTPTSPAPTVAADTTTWPAWNCGPAGCLYRGMRLSYALKFPPGKTPYDYGGTGDWIMLPPDRWPYALVAQGTP